MAGLWGHNKLVIFIAGRLASCVKHVTWWTTSPHHMAGRHHVTWRTTSHGGARHHITWRTTSPHHMVGHVTTSHGGPRHHITWWTPSHGGPHHHGNTQALFLTSSSNLLSVQVENYVDCPGNWPLLSIPPTTARICQEFSFLIGMEFTGLLSQCGERDNQCMTTL